MRILKIAVVMLVLAMSVGIACAENTTSADVLADDSQDTLEIAQDEIYTGDGPEKTFNDLQLDIANSSDVFDVKYDYKFNNDTDSKDGIIINRNNFIVNGNGHRIDANNQSLIFTIMGHNITINNLTLVNAHGTVGSALRINGSAVTNNMVFKNSTADQGVIFLAPEGNYISNNDSFLDLTSTKSGVIMVAGANATFNNALMKSSRQLEWGFIRGFQDSIIEVFNSTFADTISKYSTAVFVDYLAKIRNCRFDNLHALFTAGAIGMKAMELCEIMNCTFTNVSSQKNGGAIYVDATRPNNLVEITNCTFSNCRSDFGGAVMQLNGNLTVADCRFIENVALLDGGAIYVSGVILNVSGSIFKNNIAVFEEGWESVGGAIFADNSTFELKGCRLSNNTATSAAALYMYDVCYLIEGNEFADNLNFAGEYDDIFAVFDRSSSLDNNSYSGQDSRSLNNTDYASIVDTLGIKPVLINNSIDVSSLPSRFDLRDWGWVTPVRNQGNMGSCWAFGTAAAMESAILRYLGFEIDISENNIQDVSLEYYRYGLIGLLESGNYKMAACYALSWFGVFSSQYDAYDELGKISPIIATNSTIHFQDIVSVPPRKSVTDNSLIKEAILKYGALALGYYSEMGAPYYNAKTGAQYCNESLKPNHCVAVVGWDDDYSADNFMMTPPGDGAWIIKNSWGESNGVDGYNFISYYDSSFANMIGEYAFLLVNTEQYNKNYQYDIQGNLLFLNESNEYRNVFEALDDDLIAGVGTYFNDTNVEYSIEVFVNGQLKHSQKGTSPFAGFHTIKLDSFIPIKKGDEFAVKVKSNSVPYLEYSRQHFIPETSLYLMDGVWIDASDNKWVCCIKVYTLEDDTKIINNSDISLDYGGGSYFSVRVVTDDGRKVGAGELVKFTINGKTTEVRTDSNGIAKIRITDVPKVYTIKTTYNGKTYTNKVTVKQVLKATKVTVKKTAKKFTLKATLKINGNLVKGKKITFKFRGKTYKVKTNSKGIAQKTLKKSVIKKLKKGKTYTVKVTYLKDTIKTTVKVK